MEILNFMLAVTKPNGLWAKLIDWLDGSITNYAVVLILITLIIKVIMLPFDFYNKYVSKKNALMQQDLAPELKKIEKLYANNPNMKNQKTSELYKQKGYNIYGTCFGMLGYMVLSMVIFFTLFSALNNMSYYKIYNEYITLNNTFDQVVTEYKQEKSYETLTDEEKAVIDTEAISLAENAVVKQYGEIKNGFLWIKNIWRPDTSASVTVSYKDFVKQTKSADEISEEQYNRVMNPIKENYKGWNGYFLLAIINAGVSVLSMYVNELIAKARAKKKNLPYISTINKTTLFVLPIIMALFTIFYNSAFGIYIVTGSLFTLITSPIITILVENIFEKLMEKKKKNKPSYSR